MLQHNRIFEIHSSFAKLQKDFIPLSSLPFPFYTSDCWLSRTCPLSPTQFIANSCSYFQNKSSFLIQYLSQLPQLVKLFVDMTTLPPKENIVAALRNTFIGDSKTLKDTTTFLAEAAQCIGFSMGLMQIVDDPAHPVEIKQAALIQLKNHVKLHWSAKKEEMVEQEKESIKNAILLAVIRCNKNHKLIKIYKEIFTIIIGFQYRRWLPIVPIVERIGQEQDLVPLLHILLAIAASFEFSITEEERIYFFGFLKTALPALLELINKRQDHQLIYLSIKFLWKAIHYEISAEVKNLACAWMPLLHMVIGATNPQYDAHPDDLQTRESTEFYYFHSKKWATRIFLRFIQKHAKKVTFNKNEDNRQFTESWYTNYGDHLIAALINQFGINTTKKVRYFQLKCLQVLITERPEAVKQYAEVFQYDILLKYLRLQPEDEELANREPVEFLSREDEPSINFTNLKRVATDVWVGFSELGNKPERKGQAYEPGIFFYQNMNTLQAKLEGTDQIEKELAMYLICQLRSPITKSKQVKKMLPTLISKYVIPEFKNSIMFLRARAVDIFTEYGSMELDIDIVKSAVEGIYICLTKDQHALVRIKAASAFNCILKHSTAKDLVRPLLKEILSVYLQLLESYDLENIINSLESIVEDFASEISPFAYELVHHLTKLYFKLFNKDVEQTNKEEYDGQAELAAAGCLKTITRIIESPIPAEIIPQLEPEVLGIIEFIFGEEGGDYIEDCLILLNSYLYKIRKMSGPIWFYYQVVVYNMVGIPKEMWASLDKLPLQEKQRNVLRSIRTGDNFEMMEQSMPVLRNYIQKTSLMINEPNFEPLKNNLISLLFYLISELYKKGSNEYSGELDVTCCTALMIYMLENFQSTLPENVYAHIWEFSKINLVKFNSKMLKVLNSQLLGLLVWVAPIQILTLAHKQNLLGVLLREITIYESKYEMEHERARVILGLNAILLLPEKPTEIIGRIHELFKVNLKMVKKNADERVQELHPNPHFLDDDYEDSDEPEEFDFDDDDEFWEEQYDENYNSALDSIDEIAEFKKTIERLNVEQNELYKELIQSIAVEDLAQLDDKIQQALDKVEKLADAKF